LDEKKLLDTYIVCKCRISANEAIRSVMTESRAKVKNALQAVVAASATTEQSDRARSNIDKIQILLDECDEVAWGQEQDADAVRSLLCEGYSIHFNCEHEWRQSQSLSDKPAASTE